MANDIGRRLSALEAVARRVTGGIAREPDLSSLTHEELDFLAGLPWTADGKQMDYARMTAAQRDTLRPILERLVAGPVS